MSGGVELSLSEIRPPAGDSVMGASTVSGRCVRRKVIMANPPDGLHMRPATAFAKLARGFRCTVTITYGQKTADGRSPHELLMLLAMPGAELEMELTGEDADIAAEPLIAILAADGDDSPA